MRTLLKSVALLAVAASARPAEYWQTTGVETPTPITSEVTSTPTIVTSTSTLLTTTGPTSAPEPGSTGFKFPLSNGFPYIKIPSKELRAIEKQAHGTLPDGALPTKISPDSAAVWQLVAFNELFEVAYFADLIANITNKVPGYETSEEDLEFVLGSLQTIQAQEQLHALGANGILATASETTISPCQYRFPVDNLSDALTFAATFTDIVLGTLQEALFTFSEDGDGSLFSKLVGSVIGQEGEQDGFFRISVLPLRFPSALPFLTESSGIFAYSALNQMVVVPGTCASASTIQIPILEPLNVLTSNITSNTTTIEYSFASNETDTSNLHVVYVNSQNIPIVKPVTQVSATNGIVTVSAHFPYKRHILNGLTLAAITNSTGPFSNATDVAQAALYGPGIIEVN